MGLGVVFEDKGWMLMGEMEMGGLEGCRLHVSVGMKGMGGA